MLIDDASKVSTVNRIFWDRNPYFALFLTEPYTYWDLKSEIRNFLHKYLLHLPGFTQICSIVRYTRITMVSCFHTMYPKWPGARSPNGVLVPYILCVERWGEQDLANLARISSAVTNLGLIDRQLKMSNIVVSLDVYSQKKHY